MSHFTDGKIEASKGSGTCPHIYSIHELHSSCTDCVVVCLTPHLSLHTYPLTFSPPTTFLLI